MTKRNITDLPPDVSDIIFSYLSMKDIARLTVVSRRLRELCYRLPFLKFDDTIHRRNDSKHAQLRKFLNLYMYERKGNSIQSLSVTWKVSNDSEEDTVVLWLDKAVNNNVQQLELDIELTTHPKFELPASVLTCKSLKSLVVRFHNDVGTIENPHSGVNFPLLTCLKIKSVRIEECIGELVSSLEKLEELELEDIVGSTSINISSCSLKILSITFMDDVFEVEVSANKLEYLSLRWYFLATENEKRALKLDTPNVCKLTWGGDLPNLDFQREFKNLDYAIIRPRLVLEANLEKLLKAVDKVHCLSIFDVTLQVFKEGRILPNTFKYLAGLNITVAGQYNDLASIMFLIFETAPNLHRLCIKERSANDDGRITETAVQRGPMQSLKLVEIELLKKGGEVLKVIKYLLETASNLHRMVLYFHPPLPLGIVREINAYERASSEKVYFGLKVSAFLLRVRGRGKRKKHTVIVVCEDPRSGGDEKEDKGSAEVKETIESVKEQNGVVTKSVPDDSTKSVGIHHIGSGQKKKPHRAAEAGVECMQESTKVLFCLKIETFGSLTMGRGRGKEKNTVTVVCDIPGSGGEENVPVCRRRGRPQKPLNDVLHERRKLRKQKKMAKETVESVKEENGVETKSMAMADDSAKFVGFCHIEKTSPIGLLKLELCASEYRSTVKPLKMIGCLIVNCCINRNHVLNMKYLHQKSFLGVTPSPGDFWTRKYICETKSLIQNGLCRFIGDDRTTEDLNLSKRTTMPSLKVVASAVCPDSNGPVIRIATCKHGPSSPLVGESRAALLAIQLAASSNNKHVIIEGDSKVVCW
ncbi:F-box domain containing protein [Trema orientale]|uniref:F-box domain containing protein n=1 Tax=Trema orientale TaxID=63057 RepID=A0A2P5E677_TREOI|nr:F-box domain containing protein [Trema orientale]